MQVAVATPQLVLYNSDLYSDLSRGHQKEGWFSQGIFPEIPIVQV